MTIHQPVDFDANVSRALNDTQLIKNTKAAMGTLVAKRKAVFPDETEIEQLRSLGNALKQKALSKLPQLLEQLEEKCTQNGIKVHWAETIEQANGMVLEIMQRVNTETGVTIICATHDYRMMDICDRLMWIRDGGIDRIADRKDVDVQLSSIEGE